jgi:hypothetical protein
MDKALVGVAEAIAALREELTVAMDEGVRKRIQFKPDPVELTMQVAVTKDADGKIGWKILEVGGSYQTATTQTLKLRLTPLWRQSDGTLVADYTIASVGDAGDSIGPR